MTDAPPITPGTLRHPNRPGSPRAALSHRAFRWVFLGSFASSIGTWMQNVTLAVLANSLTHQATFVGLVVFAQLGPTLFLAPLGGVVADRVRRVRRWWWWCVGAVGFHVGSVPSVGTGIPIPWWSGPVGA